MVDEWQYLFELKTTDALSKLCTNRKVRRWHKKKNTTRDSNLQRLSYRCTSYKGIRCPYKIMTVEFMPQRFKIYQIGEHIHPMPSQLPYALLFPERLFTKPNGAIMDSALQTIQDNLNPDKAQKPSEVHENFSSGSMLESADVNTTKESREIERQAIDSAETVKTQSRLIHNSSNYPHIFDDTDVKGFIRDAAALDVKLESQIHEDCRPLTPINIPESSRDGVNNQYGNNLGENFENGAQSIDTNSWDNDVKLFLSDCAQVDIKLEKEAAD
ncbi:hypothetical protein Ddc_15090 [Ditylenchus destructor]|nr:hypothetical protein Ddc_15090 [Ditylenchus destructor]